jgi:methylmalonyl-CoA mutase N-terminal domain/subunit
MSGSWETVSGIPLERCYGPDHLAALDADVVDSLPGHPPYLRGAYPEMYRAKPWRIFQLSGHGNPEDERERIKFLLNQGETGFIMEHDRNTADHMYDPDHPEVSERREDVGMTGAVILGVRDYETVLDGIDIGNLYAHPGGAVIQHAPFALACYWTVAQRRGIDLATLRGTGQSDYFLTYLGCIAKQQVPARAGVRLNCDIIEFCTEHLPPWVPVSIAAYNGADTGLNAYEELGAAMANAVEYLDEIERRGRFTVAQVAHGVGGINLRVSMDFFEEVAKLRAARKMWHDLLRDRYGVEDERASRLRIHVVTAGTAMTYQQPLNNIVRGTVMALAAVLGGTQSLGVSGYDEAMSIPSEHAHQMSVRIQQILQHEMNLTAVADPLGGSYLVEHLSAELGRRAWQVFEGIEAQGGFVAALDSGWLHARAGAHQFEDASAVTSGERTQVGVNAFTDDVADLQIGGFEGTNGVWETSIKRLAAIRRERDNRAATASLQDLEAVCRSSDNLMPAMMAAVGSDVTLGEIGGVFREVFGDWDAPIGV